MCVVFFVFFKTDFTYWGVDWDGPVPQPEDAQTVEIPESLTCLQDSFLAVLNESIEQHFLWYRHIPRGCKTV